MSILIIAPHRNMEPWKKAMLEISPELNIEIFPEVKRPEEVTCCLLWNHPPGLLKSFPNLKWVSSLGAGVDHIMSDSDLPENVRIARIVDPNLAKDMAKMAITMISIFEKNIVQHWENKKLARWDRSFETTCHKVGVMGTGEIGKVVMDALTALNYEVHGFSYSGISYKDYTVYNHSQLDLFLKNVNVVICLLPLTKETENFVNRDFFSIMNKGSCFFNLARGKILDDDALLWALDENILAGAYLDAFRQEPLPPDHPFWKHPDIMITPHVSGITHVKTGAAQMVKNYFSYEKNETLANEIDKTKGY